MGNLAEVSIGLAAAVIILREVFGFLKVYKSSRNGNSQVSNEINRLTLNQSVQQTEFGVRQLLKMADAMQESQNEFRTEFIKIMTKHGELLKQIVDETRQQTNILRKTNGRA